MTTAPSPFCLLFLREFERLRLHVYPDAGGKPTIGYGHLLKDDEQHLTDISCDQAEAMLLQDASVARAAVLRGMPAVMLQPYEADALTSFVFNVGQTNWFGSTLYTLLLDGQRIPAAMQFRRWHHVGGADKPGLLRRRIAEELWFLGGSIDSVMNIARGVWVP